MPLKQPPHQLNPDNFGIGAPAAPPAAAPVFHLKPTKQQVQDKKLKAAQKAIKKRDDAIFKARQEINFRQAAAEHAAAKAGLTPTTSPFAGVQQGKGPGAKPFQGQGETPKANLAKTRAQLLNQGGLLKPAQAAKETAAMKALRTARSLTFSDTHQLPQELSKPSVHMTHAEAKALLGLGPKPVEIGAPPAPEEAGTYKGRTPTGLGTFQHSGRQYGGSEIHSALDAISKGLGTALEGAASVPGTALSPISAKGMTLGARTPAAAVKPTTLPRASQDVSTRWNEFVNKGVGGAAEGIRGRPNVNLPHVAVPDNFLSDEAKAASKGKPVYVDQLSDSQRFGEYSLGAKGREYFVDLAGKNGYNVKDAPQWNDADLAARALGPRNEPSATGFLRNFAADVAQQAALASAIPMFGNAAIQAIQQGSLTPAARLAGQYAEGYKNLLPHYGDRPWLENLYERPLSTGLAVAPIFRSGGIRLGKLSGLKPYRDVELPHLTRAVEEGQLKPGEDKVTLSASQHPVGRAVQAVHDAILRQAEHPADRAAAAKDATSARNPAQQVAHVAGGVAGRAGHALDQRLARRRIEALHMHARLVAGHDPALALHNYFKAGRQLPMMRSLLAAWKENGGKEAEFEALFKHHAGATSSDQMSEFYSRMHDRYMQHADQLETDAFTKKSEAGLLRDEGDAAGAKRAEEQAAIYHQAAKDIRKTATERQAEQAAYSEQAGIDIHNPKKGAQALVDSMRASSRQAASMLKSQGLIDAKGELFGDWQHRISIIDETEGPGTPRGGDHGTAGWHLAHRIAREGGLREAHDIARAEYHGTTQDEIGNVPASADVRSELAQHHAGRSRLARHLMRHVEERQRAVTQRREANAGRDLQAEAAATGIHPRTVRRAVATAVNQMSNIRELKQSGESSRVMRLTDEIKAMEREERSAHSEQSQARLARLEADLHVAQTKKAPKVKVQEIEREIAAERDNGAKGYEPSRRLLETKAQLEKSDLHTHLYELPEGKIDEVLNHVRPSPDAPVGLQGAQREAMRAAIQEGLDREASLEHLHLRAQGLESDAAKNFKALTGKDVGLAHAYDQASHHYLRALRALRDQQQALGHDPFHMHLHMPKTPYGLQPVRVTTGQQFLEGNYTRDMHFLIARDLTGLQRKAVEGRMFQELAAEPMYIEDPPIGSVTPPGWLRVPRELVENLQKINKDQGKLDALNKEWRQLGDGSHAGSRVEEGEILIARHLKDWISQALERDNPNQEISRLLSATNTYRRWMLFSLPRTYVNNTGGNPILAMVMGSRLRDLVEAVRTLNHDPERIPNTERRRGPISNVMEKPNAKMVGWQAFWRNSNAFSEDIGRVMVYLMHARKAFKSEQGMRFYNRVSYSNELWRDYLVKAAKGETPNAVIPAIKSAEAFGDLYRLSRYDNQLATAFLFHRWVGHMIHLTYWTLPTKYPGRALFIQQTAALANQYRKEHGLFPSWAIAYVPLWHEMQQAGGLPQDVVWALGTGGINPFATPGQTVDFGTVDQPKFPFQSLIANNITPLIRVPLEAGYGHRLDTLQPFQDYHGNDITSGVNWRVALNGIIANLPIANTVFPRAGLSDDTIQVPFPDVLGLGNELHPRFSAQALYDPSMRSPTALGHGELYDWLLRVAGAFGSPIRPIDAAGNRTATSAGRTLNWQAQQASKRAAKQGAADFENQLELYQKDPDAWRKKYGPGAKQGG